MEIIVGIIILISYIAVGSVAFSFEVKLVCGFRPSESKSILYFFILNGLFIINLTLYKLMMGTIAFGSNLNLSLIPFIQQLLLGSVLLAFLLKTEDDSRIGLVKGFSINLLFMLSTVLILACCAFGGGLTRAFSP